MGMTCALYAVPADWMQALRREPATAITSIREDDEVVLPNTGLEKAWHGLHYLLTGTGGYDDVLGGGGGGGRAPAQPLDFLLHGGEELGADVGYGARLFTAGETKAIDAALSSVADDQLWSRYDPAAMEAREIYPMIWDEDEDDLREEYVAYFHELKRVVRTAARQDMGLLVLIL